MKTADPRTKLLIGLLAVSAVFAAHKQETVLFQTALILAAILLLRETPSFARGLKLTAPTAVLVFFISLLSFDLNTAFFLCLRLFNLLTASLLVFKRLTPEELAGALRTMKVPFEVVFIFTTGLRFVPLMRKKIGSIRQAQMSRGIDLRFRLKNAKNFMALLGPLLTQSFLLSDELAVAMEVRGFGMKNRSSRKSYRFDKKDYWLCASAAAAFAVFLYLEFTA